MENRRLNLRLNGGFIDVEIGPNDSKRFPTFSAAALWLTRIGKEVSTSELVHAWFLANDANPLTYRIKCTEESEFIVLRLKVRVVYKRLVESRKERMAG